MLCEIILLKKLEPDKRWICSDLRRNSDPKIIIQAEKTGKIGETKYHEQR